MESYEYYKNYLRKNLSKPRFIHSVNVGNMAEKLAGIYGVDIFKAKIAGLLHDICKEMDIKQQNQLITLLEPQVCKSFEGVFHKLLHGPAAAAFLKSEFSICDEDILNAVCFHTTGHANMSMFEKIVFVADHISDERTWSDIGELQKLAVSGGIDYVVLKKCMIAIQKSMKNYFEIHHYTISTYNDCIKAHSEVKKFNNSFSLINLV